MVPRFVDLCAALGLHPIIMILVYCVADNEILICQIEILLKIAQNFLIVTQPLKGPIIIDLLNLGIRSVFVDYSHFFEFVADMRDHARSSDVAKKIIAALIDRVEFSQLVLHLIREIFSI